MAQPAPAIFQGYRPTGYGYVLPDQNGWSRYLHFQAAWLAVGTGLFYTLFGFFAGHFRRNLFPAASDLSSGSLAARYFGICASAAGQEEAWSYNVLQRLTYLLVIFVLFPLMIWTGLAMSFGFASEFPAAVQASGRPADRAQPAFSGDDIPCSVPVNSRADGRCCGISKSYARHDHWPRYTTHGVKL